MYGVISDGSGLRFETKRRKSASFISLAVCLSSSIAEIRFINSKLRCRRAWNQPKPYEDRHLEYRERQTLAAIGAMPLAHCHSYGRYSLPKRSRRRHGTFRQSPDWLRDWRTPRHGSCLWAYIQGIDQRIRRRSSLTW